MSEISLEAEAGKQRLKEFRQEFEPYIKNYFIEQKNEFKDYLTKDYLEFGYDMINDIALRDAKRLRASFVYYVAQLFGDNKSEDRLKLGVVIEVIHAYLLILDDFMDMSDTRRGGLTGHKMYEAYFKEHNFVGDDALHFGNSMSSTVAIIAANMAAELLTTLDIEPNIILNLSKMIHKKIAITGYGQLEDVVNSVTPGVTEDDVMSMLEHKTGVYTYENPIHCGAILAGVTDQKTLDELTSFAIPAGIAFQIWDDVLGMFGDPATTGKSAMDDLREGKYTLLVHKVLENGSAEQVKVLKSHLGNRQVSTVQHAEVKKIIEDTGSLEYSRRKAEELIAQAHSALESAKQLDWNQEAYEYLLGISKYTIERSK